MCRAMWVLIVGASEEANKSLRRAAGPEAQVIGMTADAAEAPGLATTTNADVILLDGTRDDARALARALREAAPEAALVWIGADPPEDAHHDVPWTEDLAGAMPGAIVKALLARRAAPR